MVGLTKTALITGGAIRVGKAISLHLAKRGYDIAIHYHSSKTEAEETASCVRALGRKAVTLQADLVNNLHAATLVGAATEALGPITCLINNASAFEKDSLDNFTHENFEKHFHVHVEAPLILIRDFARQLPEDGEGNVINITDGMHGWSISDKFLTYSLSKMAMGNIAPLLARSLAPRIRINTIAPGPTLPGKQDLPGTFSKLEKILPLERVSNLEEICDTADFLLKAKSVTGQMLFLSGGIQNLQSLYTEGTS